MLSLRMGSPGVDPTFKIDWVKSDLAGEELEAVKALTDEFSDIFSKSQYDLGSFTEGSHHFITTTEEPISSVPRRMPYKYRDELKQHIEKLLAAGVMIESETPWVTPFVVVQKKDGGIRPCLDFRKLNDLIIPDRYPLPRLDVIMEKIGNCKYYSSLDLSSGYLQIKLSEETSWKCGVITEDNIYQMLYMPFGLKNATAAFSRAMSIVLSGLEDCAISYVDDILVFTKDGTIHDHIESLRKTFERFRIYNLKLSPKKCVLASKSMTFLGFTLTGEGYKPSLSRIEIIKNEPIPNNVKEVKRFLGKAGFYRRHIKNFSMIAEPLLSLSRQSVKFEWGVDQQKAFDRLKELLGEVPNLIFPDYDEPFHIFTDASTTGLGGVLMQKNKDSGTFSAIAYCSRTLSASERRWPAVQAEMCAIIYALREFRPFIFMSDVELHTDHKPLAFLLKKAETHPHLARWLIELQNYQIKIVHVAGKQNSLADALSRAAEDVPLQDVQDLSEMEDIIEFPVCLSIRSRPRLVLDDFIDSLTLRHEDGSSYRIDLSIEQRNDPEIMAFIDFVVNGIMPSDFSENEKNQFAALCLNLVYESGVLYFKTPHAAPRIFVPVSLRALVFESFHSSPLGGGHMNIKKTLKKCKKYFWPRMHSDIVSWIRQCITCQLRHNPTPAYRAEMQLAPSNTLFAKVGLDLAGPFPLTVRGNKYILNIICWFSKYVISVPLPDSKARTIARAFLSNCYLKFGGCTELISDNASAFTSEFFKEFCCMLYINKTYAIPHWSQGNAITERSFRTYHNILSKYITKEDPDFDEFLDFASFCYNTSCHSSTSESPFFLIFGRDPIFCVDQILDARIHSHVQSADEGDFKQKLVSSLRRAWKSAAEANEVSQAKMKAQYDKAVRQPQICVGDRVLLRNYAGKVGTSKKFHLPWKGIFRVIEIDGIYATITSCISPQQNPKRVHLNQIKKCFENIGPNCTLPKLPIDEREALDEAGSHDFGGYPGHNHFPNGERQKSPVLTTEPAAGMVAPPIQSEVYDDNEMHEQESKSTNRVLRNRSKLIKPSRFND